MLPQEYEDNFAFVNKVYLLFFFKSISVWKLGVFFLSHSDFIMVNFIGKPKKMKIKQQKN